MREAKADGLRTGDNPASRENLGWGRERGRRKVRHHPAMPYEMLPGFFAGLDNAVEGHAGLKLLILTATRTNEVVGACWSEFELAGDDPVWTIPASRVKNGADHHVPLTKEMLALLASLPRREGIGPAVPGLCRQHHAAGAEADRGLRRLHRARLPLDLQGLVRQRDAVRPRHRRGDLWPRCQRERAERAYRRRKAMKKRRMVLEAWNAYVAMVVPLRKAA